MPIRAVPTWEQIKAQAQSAKDALFGRPLTDSEQKRVEYFSRFGGMNTGDVRVHEIPTFPELTNMAAFVPGGGTKHIFIDPEEYQKAPRLLDHELTHIFQNRYKVPAGTMQYSNFPRADARNYLLPENVDDNLNPEQQATMVQYGAGHVQGMPSNYIIAGNPHLRQFPKAVRDFLMLNGEMQPLPSHEPTVPVKKRNPLFGE